MPRAKILLQKVSTMSENKATQKPKCTRGKVSSKEAVQAKPSTRAAAWTRTKASETKISTIS